MEQPKWEEYMLYELRYLSDGKEHKRNEIIEAAASAMKLAPELKTDLISSGTPVYLNRGGWALTYLKQSGLIESPKRSTYSISKEGLGVVKSNPSSFGQADLEKYAGYKDFINRAKESSSKRGEISVGTSETSPEERLQSAESEIKEAVCSDLLDRVRKISPKAFENLVVELLVSMGYGDRNDPHCGFSVGKAGDGGIDGIIKQDKLGLESIYVQAKRYADNNPVSPHDVRDFCGALMTANGGTKKGIFITSSDFTKEGRDHVKNLDKNYKVILINGKELADYMYSCGIGVTQSKTIVINKVDNDYFDEE